MRMPKMDNAGSNPRFYPGSIDGSPGNRRSPRSAIHAALAYCSLSILFALPGTAGAQTVTKVSDCFNQSTSVVNRNNRLTFTNNCGKNIKIIGGQTDRENGQEYSGAHSRLSFAKTI
ncbi:hypothetical protein [Thioalkalivibrio sp. HK1]|uniref:hypothetical protein n=1 Tax=Thioalkalivibrio sp. HK1 TaxID=1469245 RepID=UPI0004B7B2AA|nr:hypothetical protein [Thioalkalivibrio sp. HK1]